MFNLTDLKVENDYDVIPAGTYQAYVDKSYWKTSNAGAEYLNVMWRITGPTQANRVVFDILNLFHEKEQVRNIALATLKKIMLASGYSEDSLKFETKEQLVERVLNCRCDIKVGVRTSAEFGDQNTIKGYAPTLEQGKSEASPF